MSKKPEFEFDDCTRKWKVASPSKEWCETQAKRGDECEVKMKYENFIVKHYSEDSMPSIKGNQFDGLYIGESREEAQEFIDWVNERLNELEKLKSGRRMRSENVVDT